jgi:chaperonin GroEL
MIVKQLFLDDSGQERLKSGIKKISGAVKSTLGPGGHTVLLESENEIGGFRVTKDGVTVARSIALYDPVENLAVQMMQEGSIETAKTAGDGTTTAIVLTEAILDGSDLVFDKSISMTKLISQINSITDYVVDEISKKSIKVTGKRLVDVATVSARYVL